jgi:cell division protease FtsH
MAKALLELETIDADQIDDIMSGKPPRPPKPTQSSASSSTPGATPAAGRRAVRSSGLGSPALPAVARELVCGRHRFDLSRPW